MKFPLYLLFILPVVIFSCKSSEDQTVKNHVSIVGAMRQTMMNGELVGKINLDSLQDRSDLYGLGPESYLKGEITIFEGRPYISRVTSDSTMSVQESFQTSAPFFVYSNVRNWKELPVSAEIRSEKDLEHLIDSLTQKIEEPFPVKVEARVKTAQIHVQNLPEGTRVSSPQDAHQGQVNYKLENENVYILGFFSREHQGVFTHHDSFIHLHLLTKDRLKMGHLDQAEFSEIRIFLPENIL